MLKVNNKKNRTTFNSVSTVEFEQVNVNWIIKIAQLHVRKKCGPKFIC